MPEVPTAPTTRDLIGRAELARIKPGACIVNVANAHNHQPRRADRGPARRPLAGAALDIHYKEPVADDDELLPFDNAILTLRMAGSPRYNGLNDFEELITQLAREFTMMRHDTHVLALLAALATSPPFARARPTIPTARCA